MNIKKEMDVIRKAMRDDPELAHAWHCNIAMMCYDAIRADDEYGSEHEDAHRVGNDAASRFMKLCFDVETTANPGFSGNSNETPDDPE